MFRGTADRNLYLAGLMTILGTGALPFAQAAEPPATATDSSEVPEEIVVTGSRIARPGFEAPTPTTVISSDAAEHQDITNIADLLNQVPAFRGSSTPATSPTGFREGAGGNFVNLRGLGANRTLVLIDGNRVVPSTSIGTTDLNLVPAIMVGRSEVVTGGASAAYGSDAVSGVVNLILKKEFVGFNTEVQAGRSEAGDANEYRFAVVDGQNFGNLHLLAGGEYDKNDGTGGVGSRDWSRRASGINVGAGGVRYIADDYQVANATYGGIVNAGPLKGTAFDASGTPYAFQYGNQFGNPNSTTQAGGTNPLSFNYDQLDIAVPYERYSALARADYQFSPELNGFVTVNYAHTGGEHPLFEPRDTNLVVQRDNAYLPASVLARMIAANVQTITIGRNDRDLGVYQSWSSNDTARIGAGLDGKLNGSWGWDVYAGIGSNKLISEMRDVRIDGAVPGDALTTRRWFNSIDAVVDPGSGAIVCRTTLTNPTNGCVPFDIFGENSSLSAAQKAYLTGTSRLDQRTYQYTGAANLHGNPFSTWAGDISIATGAEYRKDGVSADSDAISKAPFNSVGARAFNVGNPQPLKGDIEVYEGYLETVVPLAKDLPALKSVEFNGAVRATHYSLAGSVTTWKAGLTWQPINDLRFRTTKSRDIRAPNLSESFTSGVQGNTQINGGPLVTTLNTGNPNLKPESADTFAAGVAWSPAFLRNFHGSVDYYSIDISDAITTISAQQIYNGCVLGSNPSYCQYIDSVGRYLVTPANVNSLKTKGVDIELGYGFDLPAGRLDVDLLSTYVSTLITVDTTGLSVDRAGVVGGGILSPGLDTPHLLSDANIHYSLGNAGINLHARYVDGAKLDAVATPAQLNINHVSSRTYFNLAGDYKFAVGEGSHQLQIFGAINNLFNLDPPRNLPLQEILTGTTASYYDTIGRYFTVGVRLKY